MKQATKKDGRSPFRGPEASLTPKQKLLRFGDAAKRDCMSPVPDNARVLTILDLAQRFCRRLPHLRVTIGKRVRDRFNGGRRADLSQGLDRVLP
jgi:hypothetical protein